MITFTVDLEDPTGAYDPGSRYATMTRRLLALCEEHERRATFFTVGRVAKGAPELLKEIVKDGHEVAYHSHDHVLLTQEDPARFRRETQDDKKAFEDLTGKAVTGYRAPAFSMTPKTLWALDHLKECGFTYSSSIMPTRISRHGFVDAPGTPFRWPNGLIELPLPVRSVGPLKIPYLGGIYMYALPFPLVRFWSENAAATEVLWTYTHPYDIDRGEKFNPRLHGGLLVTGTLFAARQLAEQKLRAVLKMSAGLPLGERIAAASFTPPIYDPKMKVKA